MKTIHFLAALLVGLTTVPGFAQQTAPGATTFAQRVETAKAIAAAEDQKLSKFSLDFSGGTPKQLISAIEKAMGKPLNAIIPSEYADTMLPPLKMNNVDVWQLFQALELTSQKTEAYVTGSYYGGGFAGAPSSSYQQMRTSYGFRTPGARSDDSIWYFYVEKPVRPPQVTPVVPKACRFYALTSYLERGLTVDDITTAIQTGWKMLGDQETPTISFHKETKLLIAVGEPEKLLTIDGVLEALGRTPAAVPGATFSDRVNALKQKSAAGGSSPPPVKPAEQPKTEN